MIAHTKTYLHAVRAGCFCRDGSDCRRASRIDVAPAIAAFTTDLGPRSVEQRHNIARAAARLDGVVIKPGAEFSFNRTVGQCGVEQGYELAPAIVAGEVRKTGVGESARCRPRFTMPPCSPISRSPSATRTAAWSARFRRGGTRPRRSASPTCDS